MDRETIQQLRSEFPESSWALWSDDFPSEGCIEEDPDRLTEFFVEHHRRLRSDVILLSTVRSVDAERDYQLFHRPSYRSNHFRLKELIQGGPYNRIEGAFIAALWLRDDEAATDDQWHGPGFDRLVDQLAVLGRDEYDIICLSNEAYATVMMRFASDYDDAATLPKQMNSLTVSVDEMTLTFYGVQDYTTLDPDRSEYPWLEGQLRYLNDEVLD